MNKCCTFLAICFELAVMPEANPAHTAAFAQTSLQSGSSAQCSIFSAADVQQVTGKEVHNIAQQSTPGAGGRCANYATSGKMYLGVSQLTSASDYKAAVAAVPESVYPNREPLTDVGDEAMLMKDPTGKLRYLVARKGSRGVILFPSYRSGISDEQLKRLAVLALSR
jgi:hypothetical protein